MSAPWKILVYIAADNNLFPDALVSLRQIIDASRHGDAEILVQFDGPGQDSAARFRVAGGHKTVEWEATDEYTSDRGKRLEDFLDWAAADEEKTGRRGPILLVLWGHGAGLDHVYVYETEAEASSLPASSIHLRKPRAGVKDFLDAGNANRYVSNIQLARIFKEFTRRIGRNIDVLGLDACLMGLSEIAHQIRESVSVLVASDEDIPDASFPYREIISKIEKNPGTGAADLGKLMVDMYVATYNPAKDTTRVSLSSLNLSGCEVFAAAFKVLVRALFAELGEATTKNRIIRAREFSRTQSEPVYIDLFVFLTELTESFGTATDIYRAAEKALHHLYILHHGCAPQDKMINSHGLALYFPQNLDPELVAAASSSVFPVQPVTSQLMPSPAAGVKTPPRNQDKNVVQVGGRSLPIRSYQVLWREYVKLEFNRFTGWSNLVEVFLPEIPK